MGFKFFLRENMDEDEDGENENIRRVRNIPGDAVSYTHRGPPELRTPAIQIDPRCLELDILYYMFANSKIYLIEKLEDHVKLSQIKDNTIEEFEKATGKHIPKKSVDEIEYKIVMKDV